jgi:UDP-N-acetylmuramoyl-L-alanyl-D-glutamate--2,6-diaminopimelate ligase
MLLSDLAREAAPYVTELSGDCEISQLSLNSREHTRNGLFFCISGSRFDAHSFALQAIENGAAALVVERKLDYPVPQVLVHNVRAAMALMAAAYYNHPARQMKLLGVTGTKGKTTTSYLVKAIMEHVGYSCGLIGTTGNMIGNRWMKSDLTTPDPIDLQRTLREMADAGVQAVSMEVSAHAIDMHRLEGLRFEAGCYTNLSQDHLDYFKSMDRYFETKRSFFTANHVCNAALNADDETTQRIISDIKVPYSTFGICTNADIFARDIEITENGVSFLLKLWGIHEYPVHLKMTGMFNVYNALAATAIGLIMGVEPSVIVSAMESVNAVPGRAEVLDTHTPYKVILDYSHSPDALENILISVREFVRGRIISLFGCGGDRDHIKRPMMGRISGALADFSILTSDNPRSEDPLDILSSVEEGIKTTSGSYIVIENRREAIRYALNMAVEGDIVILAGKGHETYQEVMGVKRPFDEKVVVREILAQSERKGYPGEKIL